jgi:hypothetical protein
MRGWDSCPGMIRLTGQKKSYIVRKSSIAIIVSGK